MRKMHNSSTYSLIQKNGDTFAAVYSSKCVPIFLNQTICVMFCVGFEIEKNDSIYHFECLKIGSISKGDDRLWITVTTGCVAFL